MHDSKGCSRPLMAGEVLPQGITGLEGAMNKAAAKLLPGTSSASQFRGSAARLAVLLTGATALLMTALHVLSPEFSPSWRVIIEYAFGHYAWVPISGFAVMMASANCPTRGRISSTSSQRRRTSLVEGTRMSLTSSR